MNAATTQREPAAAADDSAAVLPGHKGTEVRVIPEDWTIVRLDQLSAFITKGATPTTYGFKWEASGVLFLRSECVSAEGLDLGQSMYISHAAHAALRRSDIRDGDILITITGNVGRVVLLAGVGSANINQHIARIRIVAPDVDGRYVFYFLSQDPVRHTFETITTGQAYPQISLVQVREAQLALPPPPEQRAIAEALSDVDGLLGALEALISKKRAIKQAAMQQLLTGKTRLPGFTGPWETKRLGDIAAVDPENLPSSTQPDMSFNYISLEQVDTGRLLGYSEEVFRTAPSRARRALRRDDVLVSTVRPNLMAHLLYRDQVPNAVCSTGFAVLRSTRGLSAPGFLYSHLFGHVVNKQIEKRLAGSNYPAINSRDVKQIEIPCPPTEEEQTAIATVLSDMDAEIAALERRRDKTRAIKQGMMQQLLTGRVRLVSREAAKNAKERHEVAQ